MERKCNQPGSSSSAGGSFLAISDEYDDVPIPQMTWRLLKRCIDLAADGVLCRESAATTDGNVSYVQDVLNGMRQAFLRLIIRNGQEYPSQNSEERPTADTDVMSEDIIEIVDTPIKEEQADSSVPSEGIIAIMDDTPIKEEQADKLESIPDEGNNNTFDDGIEEYHNPRLRKDVPRTAVYRGRGVRCKLCRMAFKGDTCVKTLILHTKQGHSDAATPKFLEKIRKDNSYKKILGNGIWYCTCENCLHTGLSRWDKRYDKARCRNFIGRI